MKLAVEVAHWLDKEIARGPSIIGRNDWITTEQGTIYVRYNGHLGRCDLSNFQLEETGKGLGMAIIMAACSRPMPIVRIENVLNPRFLEFLKKTNVPGRQRKLVIQELLISVDFIQ